TGTWSNTGSLDATRERYCSALLPNGKVLIAAGDNQSIYLASSDLYDPATGVWASGANLNTARNNFAAVLLTNGSFLVVGGQNTSGFLTQAESYPSSNLTLTAIRLTQATKQPAGAFQFGFTSAPDVSFVVFGGTNISTPQSNWKVLSGLAETSP